ncbi:MAG: formimidoylglutamate deiminase [Pelagimonas sp.]|uniref:formimidoylglutamate deiminase n=1 Tax=Pelagimonas sp. TaxID=2073170 RepID=UPI003D6C3A3A
MSQDQTTTVWAKTALVGNEWQSNVQLTLSMGKITRIIANAPADGHLANGHQAALLLPAPANGHSHGFQRAMAGLSEARGPSGQDSFWTWRQLMFRFLDHLTPLQVQAITAYAQMEMLEAGFGASVEFHYLHHQPSGQPYDDLAELSARIIAAADISGIGLTLLPVMYQYGGCDGRALGRGQRRFGNDLDRYSQLMSAVRNAVRMLPDDCQTGTAPHSLRAVAARDVQAIAELAQGGPVHMHLAEQLPEVAEVQAAYGARPVEWALDNLPIGPNWSLIHLTQMTPQETCDMAQTGAVAGLCPLTEASLGDGIFDGVRWFENGGRMAIGSDSNIRISLAEELRQLDTSQRLRDHSRAALATRQLSTGRRIFQAAAAGGAQAAGRGSGRIEVGAWADLLALDMSHPDLADLSPNTALDTFVFAGGNDMVRDVWSAGRHVVQDRQHIARDAITAAYRKAIKPLRDGL